MTVSLVYLLHGTVCKSQSGCIILCADAHVVSCGGYARVVNCSKRIIITEEKIFDNNLSADRTRGIIEIVSD